VQQGVQLIGGCAKAKKPLLPIRTLTAVPPLTFTADGSALTNYRIYGNTATMYSEAHGYIVDTGSVGTNVNPNLFDLAAFKAKVTRCVNGTITWLSDGMTIRASGADTAYTDPFATDWGQSIYTVSVQPNTAYNLSFDCTGDTGNIQVVLYQNARQAGALWFRRYFNKLTTGNTTTTLSFQFAVFGGAGKTVTYRNIKLQKAGNYEIPLLLNGQTHTIRLATQLAMTNDVADYIDYATQKRYNADGTTEDVTLPALPTIAGTNTLSVGTTVQPSEVMVTGRIRPVPTGGGDSNDV
jgi:hypothetical protein